MGGVEDWYVCLHVPSFPAQARLRLRPEQARTPVVILEGEPPLQTVCSATAAAHRMGLALGMTRVEIDTFSGVTVLPRSSMEEQATRSAVLQMIAAFTPRTEVVPAKDSFTCVLDMSGTEMLFGSGASFLRTLFEAVHTLGLTARIAGSRNFHACVCAAPFAHKEPWLLPHGKENECIAGLPVAALPLNEEQAARMDLWGIRTLADLSRLPEAELISRLGQDGKRLRALAQGTHPHLMQPQETPLTLEDAIEFDEPEERLEALLFVLGPMLDQLIARAQAHALALAAVTLTLALDGGGEHRHTLKPALPSSDRHILLKLFHIDIQSHPPPAAVAALRILAEPARRGQVQAGLFSPQLPETAQLDVTLAKIEAMVGEGCVGSPRLLDTHQPDSFVMERFRIPEAAAESHDGGPSVMLRRVRPATRLHMWLDTGSGQPLSFAFDNKRYHVSAAFGPWRLSGQWWSESVWSREEWDVHAKCGEAVLLCVLTHDLLHHEWRLEALYD